ncbi:MAG: flippase [Planctomycetes bacterium]|nr:flippase [Planctomycetota bacterium]
MAVRTLARNAIALLAARGATKVLSFAVSLLLVSYLGAARLGQYTSLMAAVVIGEGIVALGLPLWLIRACSRTPEDAARLVRHALFLVTLTGGTFTLGLLIQACVFGADRLQVAAYGITGMGLSLWAVGAVYNAATSASERMHHVALIDVVCVGIRVGLVAAVVALRLGVLELAGAYAVAQLIAAILASAISPARFRRPEGKPGGRGLDRRLLREMLSGTWPFALTALFVGLYFRADVYVLLAWHGERGVGLFDAAYRLISEGIAAAGILGGILLPQLSAGWKHDPAAFHRLFAGGTRLCSSAACAVALTIWLLAEPLAELYAGDYAGTSSLLRVLSPSIALAGAGAPAINAVLALGREKTWLACVAIVALAKLAGNLLWVPEFGPVAAAWASVTSEAALLGALVFVCRRLLGTLSGWGGAVTPLMAAALGAAVGLLFPQNPWTGAILGLATYGTVLLAGGFFTSEDARRWRELWSTRAPAGSLPNGPAPEAGGRSS